MFTNANVVEFGGKEVAKIEVLQSDGVTYKTWYEKILEKISLSIRIETPSNSNHTSALVFLKDQRAFYEEGYYNERYDSGEIYLYAEDKDGKSLTSGTFIVEYISGPTDSDPFWMEGGSWSGTEYFIPIDENNIDSDIPSGTYRYRISYVPSKEIYTCDSIEFIIVVRPVDVEVKLTQNSLDSFNYNVSYSGNTYFVGDGDNLDMSCVIEGTNVADGDDGYIVIPADIDRDPLGLGEYGKQYSITNSDGTFTYKMPVNFDISAFDGKYSGVYEYLIYFKPYENEQEYKCIPTSFNVVLNLIACPECGEGDVVYNEETEKIQCSNCGYIPNDNITVEYTNPGEYDLYDDSSVRMAIKASEDIDKVYCTPYGDWHNRNEGKFGISIENISGDSAYIVLTVQDGPSVGEEYEFSFYVVGKSGKISKDYQFSFTVVDNSP